MAKSISAERVTDKDLRMFPPKRLRLQFELLVRIDVRIDVRIEINSAFR